MSVHEHLVGKKLKNGRYDLRKLLAATNMSVVYKAFDNETREFVAIKIRLGIDPESQRRFRNEAEVMRKRLRHDHIVMALYHNLDELSGELIDGTDIRYIVFEWAVGEVDGMSLQSIIDAGTTDKPLKALLNEACQFCRAIGSALEYIHSKGLVHRDIKPSNVLIDRFQTARLADFGIASIPSDSMRTEVDLDDGQHTRSDARIGSPRFKSPDMVLNVADVSGASDQYSFALTLYEYLSSGRSPYDRVRGSETQNTGTTMTPDRKLGWEEAHVKGTPTSLLDYRSDIPLPVWQVLQKALSKAPQERYPSMQRFVEAFCGAIQATVDLHAAPASAQALPPTPVQTGSVRGTSAAPVRIPQSMLLLILVVIFMLGVIIVLLLTNSSSGVAVAEVPTATTTASQQPTDTLVPSDTPLPTDTPTDTPTATFTPNATMTLQAILAQRATETSIALEAARLLGMTATADSETATALAPTATPTPTETFTPTASATLTPSPTATATASATFTATASVTPTAIPALGGGTGVIAFVSRRSGNLDIWTFNMVTGELHNLTEGSLYDEDFPRWSPDGNTILFTRRIQGDSEIWTMDADGGNPQQLTDAENSSERAAFSPDGSLIVFDTNRDGNAEIYIMNADGTDQRNISQSPFSAEFFPAWSTDGGSIVYTSDKSGFYDLVIVDLATGFMALLTTGAADEAAVSWAPANEIVFRANIDDDENYDIYVLEPITGTLTQLTFQVGADTDPVWSPDGEEVIFASTDANGVNRILSINRLNGLMTPLIDASEEDFRPSWQP